MANRNMSSHRYRLIYADDFPLDVREVINSIEFQ